MKRNVLSWWIPAIAIAILALVEGAMHVRPTRAARPGIAHTLTMDVAGDGRAAVVHLTRIDNEAWADVTVGTDFKSTTRVGDWREDATFESLDVNGDGRADLVRRYVDHGKRVAEVWLSNGTAFEQGWRGPSDQICVAQR